MKHKPKIWDIEYAKNKLGDELCDALLVIHALLGCDATTRVCAIGKVTMLNKCNDNIDCRRLEKVLLSSTVKIRYSGSRTETLAHCDE